MNAARCPDRETLAAYLSGSIEDPGRETIEGHLRGCDPCLREAMAITSALAAAEEAARPVPAPVRLKAAEAAAAAWPARLRRTLRRWRAGQWLRLPVLAPAAALGVLLIGLAVVPGGRTNTVPYEGTRDVQVPGGDELVVSVAGAAVRERPHDRARTLASLPRGTRVRVLGETAGWFEIAGPQGVRGWVDRRDFEDLP